jgi:hypothetical protein
MGDLICVKCGELWDSFGITYAKGEGDLTMEEVRRFMKGEGCPGCGFGTLCTRCNGGGIEKNGCATCFGSGYVYARRCPTAVDERFRRWFIGYTNSPDYPVRTFETVEALDVGAESPEESLEGTVYVSRIKCPDCHAEGEPCSECGGDGKFHREKHPDYFAQAVGSLLDNSDAEPIGVLMRFMGGIGQ